MCQLDVNACSVYYPFFYSCHGGYCLELRVCARGSGVSSLDEREVVLFVAVDVYIETVNMLCSMAYLVSGFSVSITRVY